MEIQKKFAVFSLLPFCFFCAHSANALKVERLPIAGPASVSAAAPPAKPGREVASGRAFVEFGAGLSSAAAAGVVSAAGFELVDGVYPGGWNLVLLPHGMSVSSALSVLKSLPGVAAVEPSGVYHVKRKSSDPALVLQYSLRRADAFRAWDYETGASSRVTVAVMDTGIDGSHPELVSKLAVGSQFFDPNNNGVQSLNDPPTPACNHATRVAGAAAAASDNNYGIAGISWDARLLSLKIFNDADCNTDCSDAAAAAACSTDDVAIIKAINYAVGLNNSAAAGRIVLNMSIGEGVACSVPLQAALTPAATAGLVLIAAAGNSPVGGIDSPANCLGVMPVGATDINDNIASFSARGTEMSSRGVVAPGVGIYTTDLRGSFAYGDGTSFASPFAAGLAALVLSANPALTGVQAGDIIRNSADNLGSRETYGFGRVNAYKAVLLALGKLSSYSTSPDMAKAYAYPNPYKPSSTRPLAFSMPDSVFGSGLEISIYTSEGEKVKKVSEPNWDGKNEAGYDVASGVYLFFMKTDKGSAVGKFAVLR
ncbi:MAG: hypothetical protein A2270_02470 [Elusimicrobia bacterium RIFOXYA12_FULL_51_18]|nr:MAG: hypothetical protein A2270_02470 [Elusimicrobia bacterium RIFOXYA12_FULL_51_18]OGS31279.1 MAG: hypothetical protein A2218_08055 [Elusimicrobia bacterium RIFOXYA2_FULL_53_38]